VSFVGGHFLLLLFRPKSGCNADVKMPEGQREGKNAHVAGLDWRDKIRFGIQEDLILVPSCRPPTPPQVESRS